uniref:Uncharacterized protein n=1 Tax=Rhizophora mucronata TaxID=61149 RepID=A0A2P2QJK8_RHIMU
MRVKEREIHGQCICAQHEWLKTKIRGPKQHLWLFHLYEL